MKTRLRVLAAITATIPILVSCSLDGEQDVAYPGFAYTNRCEYDGRIHLFETAEFHVWDHYGEKAAYLSLEHRDRDTDSPGILTIKIFNDLTGHGVDLSAGTGADRLVNFMWRLEWHDSNDGCFESEASDLGDVDSGTLFVNKDANGKYKIRVDVRFLDGRVLAANYFGDFDPLTAK